MIDPTPAPFACRIATITGVCSQDEFCAFDFPWCEGCPKSQVGKSRPKEDPMKSPIWQHWINGISGIKK
jgi:hypothetical protein